MGKCKLVPLEFKERAASVKSFGLPSHRGFIFWLQFYRQDDPGAIPHHQKHHRGGGFAQLSPQNILLSLRQPLHEASNPQLMGFWGCIYIHLHGKLPPASSRNTYCRFLQCRTHILRKFGTSDDCEVVLSSENFAVIWLAFLHFVVAVEVMSYAPNSALLNTGFVIHFGV
jgi:hypothetical protein